MTVTTVEYIIHYRATTYVCLMQDAKTTEVYLCYESNGRERQRGGREGVSSDVCTWVCMLRDAPPEPRQRLASSAWA